MELSDIIENMQKKIETLELLIAANLKNMAKSAAGAPGALIPDFIGQIYIDTSVPDVYSAYGISAGNWKKTT